MSSNTEVILSTIDGSDADERLLVVLNDDPCSGSVLQLRQQTWADGIGWYTQNTIELSPRQIGQLRGILGTRPVTSARNTAFQTAEDEQAAIIPIAAFARAHSA